MYVYICIYYIYLSLPIYLSTNLFVYLSKSNDSISSINLAILELLAFICTKLSHVAHWDLVLRYDLRHLSPVIRGDAMEKRWPVAHVLGSSVQHTCFFGTLVVSVSICFNYIEGCWCSGTWDGEDNRQRERSHFLDASNVAFSMCCWGCSLCTGNVTWQLESWDWKPVVIQFANKQWCLHAQ